MKKPVTLASRLAERIQSNRHKPRVSDELAGKLLVEYLDEAAPTSYRKLAAKYDVGVHAVMRAIKRAAETAQ